MALFVGQIVRAQLFKKVDNAIYRINHYPADNVIGFPNTCSLDCDLSGG